MNLKICLLSLILLCAFTAKAQSPEIDSLKKLLNTTENGIKRINILEGLSYAYLSSSPDTALKYALDGMTLSKNIDSRIGEAICTNAIGNVYFHIGDNAKALEAYLQYLKIKEELKDYNNLSIAYFNIGSVYTEMEDFSHALYYLFKAKQADVKVKDTSAMLYDDYALGSTYLRMKKNDSALYYINETYKYAKILNEETMIGAILNTYGEAYFALDNFELALKYYKESNPYAEAVQDDEVVTSNYFGLSKIFKQKNNYDSAVFYARKALNIAKQAPFYKQVLEISVFLTDLFKAQNKYDSAFYYQALSIETKDSLFNVEQVKKVQNLKFSEQQRQQAIATAKLQFRSRVKLIIVIFACIVFLVLAIIFWRNNKQKKVANFILQDTLENLRSTQAQLIQSEKMASLGELTAGIAHEIQNPLNFVNNFSEINKEMLEELKEEYSKPITERDEETQKDIVDNLVDNSEKINRHGKRADAIVKSMLQHSRSSSGQKESTVLNDLCDEYMRLSYHGMRAKDKSFNAIMESNFDESIFEIDTVPQDIGRVLLNIFNNAFYAVNERQKAESLKQNAEYKPTVSVQTKKYNLSTGHSGVEIIVTDNGNGIPQSMLDKIFQPFFTTKPTGQGTGLGLSLSYDIIKANGGEMKVESTEGEGSTFIIQLPITA